MKKWTSFILILIIALNLAGCSNRNVNRNLQNKPDITGTVLEVQDNSILLEINKEGYPDGTRCKVSLNEKWIPTEYHSKSCNSPFTGWELYGKVKRTICAGKTVYTD